MRELLGATGGDVEELVRWAACVLDTVDDTGAVRAYAARREGRETEVRPKTVVAWTPYPKRRRFRRDRYEEHDYRILALASDRLRPGCSPTQAIREEVEAEWNRLGKLRAPIKLGISEDAVVARIFQRLRPEILAPGLRISSLFAECFPRLSTAIAPRRLRGVSRIGRPKRKF
jgi:hypothetical protein